MSNQNAPDPQKVMTPEFRVTFAHVFRPQKPLQESQQPKYGVTMLFKKGEDLSALKKAVKAAIVDKWGGDKTKWPGNLRLPFRDQGEKEFDGFESGAVFSNATTTQRPGLVDANVNEIIDESEFYSGCYAKATVRAFAYDKAGNKGVGFGLNNIQKLRDGDPLGDKTRPEDDFEAVGDEDPIGGDDLDDDIAF